jgi:hypothetical protein
MSVKTESLLTLSFVLSACTAMFISAYSSQNPVMSQYSPQNPVMSQYSPHYLLTSQYPHWHPVYVPTLPSALCFQTFLFNSFPFISDTNEYLLIAVWLLFINAFLMMQQTASLAVSIAN